MKANHASCLEDVQAVRAFLAVAESLSFTRAAEAMFVTQSAVSHQVARLERALGARLLDRRGRNVSLTPAGAALVESSRRVFASFAEAELAVRRAERPDLGHLRIGATVTACEYLIPTALREFRECFPSYTLSITPGDSPESARRLTDGQIDLGLMIRVEGGPRLDYRELFADELGLVVSPLHPWARPGAGGRVRPPPASELAGQTMVLYSRNSATYGLVERHFARLKAPLRDVIELGSIKATVELVKLGLGVSVLARWAVRPELAEGSLAWVPLPGPRLRRSWCVGTSAGRPLSTAEQTFVGLCAAAAAELADPPAAES